MQYLLPCSASFLCIDRFSVLDDPGELEDADGRVPFWPVFTALVLSPVKSPSQLVELLDTIAVTLRDTSEPAGDYQLLLSVISGLRPNFFDTEWPFIVELALELPSLFPGGRLRVLGAIPTLDLTKRQTACLVAHQFLCTLRAPDWREDFFDFSIWYGSAQRHEEACRIYLTCLFTYLDIVRHAAKDSNSKLFISYRLVTAESGYEAMAVSPAPLGPVEVVLTNTFRTCPEHLGLPSGAAVVAANRYVGFGQSATQEEVHVGSSPEACPAVLITPPLGSNQVLVVKSAEAVLNIVGQRRDIKATPQSNTVSVDWSQRTMLFMDALELDGESDNRGLPDLAPGNLLREVNKAAIAFSSSAYDVVYSPLWGCGAFGGDPFVKVLLLWCAASVASVPLRIICDSESEEIAKCLDHLIEAVKKRLETAQDVMCLLESMPRDIKRLATFRYMIDQLGDEPKITV
jgi:poly(ADP-ribose) glycohydrolase